MIKTDVENLVKTETGAVINTDRSGFDAYVAQRNAAMKSADRVTILEHKINNMSSDLTAIKDMLQQILGNTK